MSLAADSLTGGFDNPVFDAQAVFRLVMDGMARPGTVKTVAVKVTAPSPLGIAAGAIALTLADHDTPVWLSPGLQKTALPDWLAFHTGAPLTREKAEARFAFTEAGANTPSFGLFFAGTQDYPDRSATLVIEIGDVETGRRMILSGPGIAGTREALLAGLPEGFVGQWTLNRALFPRGIDVILTAGDRFLCLPRTTLIEKAEG